MEYTVVIEKGESSYGAYVPDLPGCVAVSQSLEEVQTLIKEAIEFHLESMRLDGLEILEPTSRAIQVQFNSSPAFLAQFPTQRVALD